MQTNVERLETNIKDLEAIVKKEIPATQQVRLSSRLDQNRNFPKTNFIKLREDLRGNPAYVSFVMHSRSQVRIKGEDCVRQSTTNVKLCRISITWIKYIIH